MLLSEIIRRCRDDLEQADTITRNRWNMVCAVHYSSDPHLKSSTWSDLIESGVFFPLNKTTCRIDIDRLYHVMSPNPQPIPLKAKRHQAAEKAEAELEQMRAQERMGQLMNAKTVA
jgi:hypothetical protein